MSFAAPTLPVGRDCVAVGANVHTYEHRLVCMRHVAFDPHLVPPPVAFYLRYCCCTCRHVSAGDTCSLDSKEQQRVAKALRKALGEDVEVSSPPPLLRSELKVAAIW